MVSKTFDDEEDQKVKRFGFYIGFKDFYINVKILTNPTQYFLPFYK